MGNYLAISDLQIPFEHPNALKFCLQLKKFFKISDDNCLCVGDEVDQYFGSQFGKDPDAKHSPLTELEVTKDKIKEWASVFPKLKIAISNHGVRWAKRAFEAQIPSQLIRHYQEVIGAPQAWKWKDEWTFMEKHPFRMIHGMGYAGINGHRTAAMDAGISTVIGHLHSHGGIAHIRTATQKIWGANSGCLIDVDAYAFNYGKESRFKPTIGALVILNDGSMPVWTPLD